MGTTPKPRPRKPWWDLLVEVPAVIGIFLMMLHVTVNALLRTIVGDSVPHTLETVKYFYLPVVALLGFVIAQRRGEHITADLLFAHLPTVVKPYALALLQVLCVIICACFAWFSWPEAFHAYRITMTAGTTEMISWPVYFLPPVIFTILAVQFAWAAVRAVSRPVEPEAAGAADLDGASTFGAADLDLETK